MSQEESEVDSGLEQTAPSRRKLVAHFALLSLVAFALVGVAIHVLAANQVRRQHEEFVHFHAVFVADQVLSQIFSAEDLAGPIEGSRAAELTNLSKERVLVAGVTHFRVFRLDGTIVYSDRKSLIGSESPSELRHIRRALSDGPFSLHQDPQVSSGSLLQTYAPIRPHQTGSPAGVAMIAQDFEPAQAAARRSVIQLDGILFGGLILIYVLLLPIARRTGLTLERYASRLRSQATTLARLLSREKETVRRLRELDDMKTDFVATTSHELRTPLTGIIGFLGTLKREEVGSNPQLRTELIESAERHSQRLLRLIEQLLEASVLDRRRRQVKTVSVNFEDLARSTVAGMGGTRKNVGYEFPSDLETIETDPEILDQILMNLLDNALKYSPPDSKCTIGARRDNDAFLIWVEDRGIGMTPEQVERIFDPFWQADGTSTRKYGGVGLGLHIVRGLVESLDGTIQVESALGKGSRFTVRLPDRRDSDNRQSLSASEDSYRSGPALTSISDCAAVSAIDETARWESPHRVPRRPRRAFQCRPDRGHRSRRARLEDRPSGEQE